MSGPAPRAPGEQAGIRDEVWTWEFVDPGASPDVSIIVCVHGRTDMTLECLDALHRAQRFNLSSAELIVVDDASPDDTPEWVASVRGLTLVRLDGNVGFLRAANHGLARARGRHVLFLNNDTLPQGRWLDPLVETLEERPRALVAGSTLVFTDGVLQEAGGIVFSDGSGWNYGRGMDAGDPRVTFARQVDYVSGASMLVDGQFLRERGGFDERYAPAYYEDTDLCFAARQAGGEVWFEPRSIVVHLEGQSHGTDESSGIKAYQAVNREKFRTRWASDLRGQWPPDGAEVVPSARQRSGHGHVVMVDAEVPAPDRDSGSLRQVSLMHAMLDLGYAVTFLPLNGWRREPYTSRLERLGVEVLGVPDQWWDHLASLRRSVTHVWMSRPHVAEVVRTRLAALLPQATTVYDTVDLHHLRERREAQVTGDAEGRAAADETRQRERALMHSCDLTVVVSPVEADLLGRDGVDTVRVIPNVHQVPDGWLSPRGRSDLLFVGGFRHTPNTDAVRWFVHEILPLVRHAHPDVVLNVIGSYVTDDVRALESAHVRIHGWVRTIEPHYASARAMVAPLRFGAGVKGKVGEALALGVPSVLTTVAAEGMHVRDGTHALVADDAAAFAAAVVRILDDDELWASLSTAGRDLVRERFGPETTRRSLAEVLMAPRRAERSWA